MNCLVPETTSEYAVLTWAVFNRTFFLTQHGEIYVTRALHFHSEEELCYVVNFVLISHNGSLYIRDV